VKTRHDVGVFAKDPQGTLVAVHRHRVADTAGCLLSAHFCRSPERLAP
jgi:hypothetical protein